MTVEQLRAKVLKLSRDESARFAEALIQSLDEESGVEQAWDEEADRRYPRYLAGHEDAAPLDDSLAELRAELLG